MLGLKLNHVSKRGHSYQCRASLLFHWQNIIFIISGYNRLWNWRCINNLNRNTNGPWPHPTQLLLRTMTKCNIAESVSHLFHIMKPFYRYYKTRHSILNPGDTIFSGCLFIFICHARSCPILLCLFCFVCLFVFVGGLFVVVVFVFVFFGGECCCCFFNGTFSSQCVISTNVNIHLTFCTCMIFLKDIVWTNYSYYCTAHC